MERELLYLANALYRTSTPSICDVNRIAELIEKLNVSKLYKFRASLLESMLVYKKDDIFDEVPSDLRGRVRLNFERLEDIKMKIRRQVGMYCNLNEDLKTYIDDD